MDGSRSECLVAADQCPTTPSRLTNESEVWFLRYRGKRQRACGSARGRGAVVVLFCMASI